MIAMLTISFAQIGGDDLLFVVLLRTPTTDFLNFLGPEQLFNLIKNALLAELSVFLLPFFGRRSMRRPVTCFWSVDLVPMERLQLLLRSYHR